MAYPEGYNSSSIAIRQTDAYARWFEKLRNREARVRILARIRRLSLGNPGLVRSLGGGVLELKINYGAGYRVYLTRSGKRQATLLVGGDKRTQKRDIQMARVLVSQLRER